MSPDFNTPGLTEIAGNPFVLEKIIEKVLKGYPSKHINYQRSSSRLSSSAEESINVEKEDLASITRYEMYDLLIRVWAIRDNAFEDKIIAIAKSMISQKADFLPKDFIPQEEVDFADNNTNLLKVLEDDSCSFVKSDFKDFLVAREIVKEIRGGLTMKELAADGLIKKMNLQQHPAILKFILDEVTSEDAKELEEIILSTGNGQKTKVFPSNQSRNTDEDLRYTTGDMTLTTETTPIAATTLKPPPNSAAEENLHSVGSISKIPNNTTNEPSQPH